MHIRVPPRAPDGAGRSVFPGGVSSAMAIAGGRSGGSGIDRSGIDGSGMVRVSILDRITDGVFVIDRAWTCVFVNAAGAASIDLSPAESVDCNLWTMFPSAIGTQFERECRHVMEHRKAVEFEARGPAPDQWRALRIFPTDEGITIYSADMSELRRSERDVRRLAAIVEASDDAVISQSLDGIVLTWNAAAERMFGYRTDGIVGRPVVGLTPTEHLDEERELLARVRAGERVEHQLATRVRSDGTVIRVSISIFPISDHEGTVVGFASIARDLTAQRFAENPEAEAEAETGDRHVSDARDRDVAPNETLAALRLVEARARSEEALAELALVTLEATDIASFGRTACGLIARDSRSTSARFCFRATTERSRSPRNGVGTGASSRRSTPLPIRTRKLRTVTAAASR